MTRSGFVAISGQPNVGKSTILNAFLGEKLAITSARPETTRDNIRGILTGNGCQMIFVDTPGIHKPHDLLGKVMLSRAQSSIMESDIILLVTEKNKAFNAGDEMILSRFPSPEEDKKVILVINKVDRIKEKATLLPLMEKAAGIYPFAEIMPMSALDARDIERLLKLVRSHLPEGPFLYPEEQLTDRGDDFIIREIVREKILNATYQEVPHSVAVVVEMIDRDDPDMIKVHATIYVERLSQKSIIIGRNGSMISEIGKLARREIEGLLEKRVYLDLWVKVFEKWKKDPRGLREMGYTD